ncbi:MAG: hypothetical protein MUP22_05315 [Desulfobacterales bacterium]|nr:hypothetical protein [Desulfobacterales bacterium]
MKNIAFLMVTFFIALLPLIINGAAFGSSSDIFKASFSDAIWNAVTVPKGQQCKKFGGKSPSTPQLLIQHIPVQANAIVMEYSDRSWPPMDNGGHGKIGFNISTGTKEVTIPSVPGHSFKMPEGFFIIAPHQSPGWDEPGAYMPPCSGGAGNKYYVTIKAVVLTGSDPNTFKELAQVVLEMGKY